MEAPPAFQMFAGGYDRISIIQPDRQRYELNADADTHVQFAEIKIKAVPPSISDIRKDAQIHEILDRLEQFHSAHKHGQTANRIFIVIDRADITTLESADRTVATSKIPVKNPDVIPADVGGCPGIQTDFQGEILYHRQIFVAADMETRVVAVGTHGGGDQLSLQSHA